MEMLRIRNHFSALIDKRNETDKLALALMSNRDTPRHPEYLLRASEMKINIHERMCDAVTALRKKYPDTRTMLHPWNRAEYNQYQRVTEEIV
jgi:hypothetical protein